MGNIKKFLSRKEVSEFLSTKNIDTSTWTEEKWLSLVQTLNRNTNEQFTTEPPILPNRC